MQQGPTKSVDCFNESFQMILFEILDSCLTIIITPMGEFLWQSRDITSVNTPSQQLWKWKAGQYACGYPRKSSSSPPEAVPTAKPQAWWELTFSSTAVCTRSMTGNPQRPPAEDKSTLVIEAVTTKTSAATSPKIASNLWMMFSWVSV